MAKEDTGALVVEGGEVRAQSAEGLVRARRRGRRSTLETGYSREMLKEMIERRQRNDFVRRREFDMLRKLRQREAAGGARRPRRTPSSFNVSSTSGKTDGRALTLKKIDEIEEQMSQQWWKSNRARASAARQPVAADEQPRAFAPTHGLAGAARPLPAASAFADDSWRSAGCRPGAPCAQAPGPAPAPDLRPSAPARSHPSREESCTTRSEEAAIRFAHGDDAGAEAILLQALAPAPAPPTSDDTWLALLDLYRATGDTERFEATGHRLCAALQAPAPEWISLRRWRPTPQRPAAAAVAACRRAPAMPTGSARRSWPRRPGGADACAGARRPGLDARLERARRASTRGRRAAAAPCSPTGPAAGAAAYSSGGERLLAVLAPSHPDQRPRAPMRSGGSCAWPRCA